MPTVSIIGFDDVGHQAVIMFRDFEMIFLGQGNGIEFRMTIAKFIQVMPTKFSKNFQVTRKQIVFRV